MNKKKSAWEAFTSSSNSAFTFCYAEHILWSNFDVLRITEATGPTKSIANELLKLWQNEFNEEITKIIHLLAVK